MAKQNRWLATFALAVVTACHDTARTPAELPVASPLNEAPTASPVPPLPPEKNPDATKLTLAVVTGSPEGFLVNSALVTGKHDALLIDAQFTLPDAARVAAAIDASGTQKPSSIAFTKEYLAAYEEALASAKSAADLEARIEARFPDTALDAIVRIAAEAAFPTKTRKRPPAPPKAKP